MYSWGVRLTWFDCNSWTINFIRFEIPVANPTQLGPKRSVKIKPVV